MNANESLSHEWIIDNHNNPNETLRNYTFANKELFSHVANFHDAPPLEKILVNQAVSELTDDDKQWLKTQFNKIDVKKIGIITIDDICNFLLKTDDTLDERKALVKASKLVNMMDVSNKGQITLKDFVRAKTLSLLYAHLGSNEEIQLKGFEMLSNKLDRNNTGQIDSSMLEVELARSLTTAEKNAFMKQISQFQSSSSSSSSTMNVNSSGNEQLSLMSSNVSNISNVSSGSSNNNNNNNNGKGVSTTAKNLSEIEMGNGVEDRGLEMINSGSGMIDLKLVGYLGSVPPSDNEFDTSDNDDHNTNNNNNNNNNNSKYSKVATKITANTSDQGTAALSDGNQSSLEMDINNNRKRKDGKGNHRVKSNKQMVPGSSLEINVIPPPCAQTDTEMQNGNGGNNNNNNNRMTTMTIPSQKGHRSDKSTSI